jgi:hypothetical protein
MSLTTLFINPLIFIYYERDPDWIIIDQLKKKSYYCLEIRIARFIAPDYTAKLEMKAMYPIIFLRFQCGHSILANV